MIKLTKHSEFLIELHKEKVLPPHRISTNYKNLNFECGCGQFHDINDNMLEKVGTYFPVKIIFKCHKNLTNVQIKGFFKQKCISLWTIESNLVDDIASDLGF